MGVATGISTIIGSTRRITFTIPPVINVAAPTAYRVSLAGQTTTGVAFASSNTATLTVNPTASLVSVTPNIGTQGEALSVNIQGSYTNFIQGATQVSFAAEVTVNSVAVADPTHLTASITIQNNAPVGPQTVVVKTGIEQASLPNSFTVQGIPLITQINPNQGQQGQQNLSVAITGQYTHFVQGTTVASFGPGVTAASLTINSATSATAVLNIDPVAVTGPRDVSLATNSESATLTGGFSVQPGVPIITQVNPNQGQQGQQNLSVTITAQYTHWMQGTTTATFGAGVTVAGLTVNSSTSATALLNIDPAAATGLCDVTVTTNAEVVTLTGGFSVQPGAPVLLTLSPTFGQQGQQNLSAAITGQYTHFSSASTITLGASITTGNVAAVDATHLTALLSIVANAPNYASTVVGDQPVAYFRLDEAAGATLAVDSSGSGNTGTYQGTPTLGSPGLIFGPNTAVRLGGLGSFSIADSPSLDFLGLPFTLEAWVKGLPPSSTTPGRIFDKSGTAAGAGYALEMNADGVSLIGSTTLTVAHPLAPAGTYHVVATSDGAGNGGIYVNGVLAGSGPYASAQPYTGSASIGVASDGTRAWPGTLDEVAIYNTALAPQEILAHYQAGSTAANLTVTTGTETVTLANAFSVTPAPALLSVAPSAGQQGQSGLSVLLTGQLTHFVQGTTTANFGPGVTVTSLTVNSAVSATAVLNIDPAAAVTTRNVTLTTNTETATVANGFSVEPGTPVITQVNPNQGQQGQQNLSVAITGQYTHFAQGTSVASFGLGVTVASLTINSTTSAAAVLTIDPAATTGPRDVSLTTGSEKVVSSNGFTVTLGGPAITDFNPKSGPVGTLVTVSGLRFSPTTGVVPQLSLSRQGVRTLTAVLSSFTNTTLTFVIPAGAATGPLTVTGNGQSSTSAALLTITPSSDFTLTAVPPSANLIQGQSISYAIQMTSGSGFSQLAQLGVTGVPSGVTAFFKPATITAGQTSTLTLTAPANQALGSANLSISVSAMVDGLPVTQNAGAAVSVVAPTTTLLGRTVVSDALETSLSGVTITTLGKDGNGQTTGCTGHTAVSDAAGNFALANLPLECTGPQLIGFDGTTANSPPGKYAGVNLVFTLNSGQVTVSPVLVHLPRIDNVETFLVTQNSPSDQSHDFTSIPGLSVTVYKGTTFTMPDGTQPDPFPLAAVQVPIDRLPDAKPTVPTMMMVFIVAFQPANATTSQPVAVTFPNTINTPPGSDMPLMTLDPTHGTMVPYGTGTVSSNGTQIVPDADPAHTGHLYGLVHFDWHGPMPAPANTVNPSPAGGGTGSGIGGCSNSGNSTTPTCQNPCDCQIGAAPQVGEPVDLASGLLVSNVTDMVLSGGRGTVAIHRIYRTLSTNDGPFGPGSGHTFNYQLDIAAANSAQAINLINPDGSRFLFSRQSDGTLINTTVPTLQGVVMRTTVGDAATLRYRDGTVMVFQRFNLFSLEVSLIDSNGNQINISRNSSNPQQIVSISDPVGRSLAFAYVPGTNHVASITDPTGRAVNYTYNASGTLATVTDPGGNVTKYFYDSQNRLLSSIDPRGATAFLNVFDTNGRVIQQTQADSGVIQIFYELANPTVATSFTRDVLAVDPNGNATFYRFNPQGFVIQAIDALGQSTVFSRDPGNNLVLSAGGNAVCPVCLPPGVAALSFSYDSNGNELSRTDGLGKSTTYSHEPIFGKITSITDPLSNVTHLAYDSRGNLLTRADPDGNTTTFSYDGFGELTQVMDALQQKTILTYDAYGDLSSVTDPLGNTSSYSYDAISRLAVATDALRRQTAFTYDAMGRLLTQKDAKGGLTQFAYDPNGNLTSVTDARNNVNTFVYDFMNRLSYRKDVFGNTDLRVYDKNGNLAGYTDRRGQASTFSFDALNRLTTETYLDATVTRTYDAFSRLSQIQDSASGTFGFVYDLAGRLVSSSSPFGSVEYSYDSRGQMATRQVAGQPILSYSYDPAGNLTGASMPSASASFTYDPRNALSSMTRMNGVTSSFGYDPAARLSSITHSGTTGVIDAEAYDYDPVGNRTSHSTSISQPLVTQAISSSYNVANELTSFGSAANTYDTNGNLTQDGAGAAYAWDGRNRLKSITTVAGQTTTFTYDFTGQLIQQADIGPALNLTKSFVLDKATNVSYETSSDGSSYSVLTGRSIDSHLAVIQSSGQIQYGLADGVNSTIATTDQTGAVSTQYFYEPFGQTTTMGAYPFQFSGRIPVSGSLYYNRARFYNSQTGRFISEDPIGLAGGDTNLYRYVWGNPTTLIDPVGLQGWLSNAAQQGREYAGQLADYGNLPAAFGAETLSLLVQASLFTPLGQEIDILTDPCKSIGQKAFGVALAIGLEGSTEALGELGTAYLPYSGYGLDRSILATLAFSTFRVNTTAAAWYTILDTLKTSLEVYSRNAGR